MSMFSNIKLSSSVSNLARLPKFKVKSQFEKDVADTIAKEFPKRFKNIVTIDRKPTIKIYPTRLRNKKSKIEITFVFADKSDLDLLLVINSNAVKRFIEALEMHLSNPWAEVKIELARGGEIFDVNTLRAIDYIENALTLYVTITYDLSRMPGTSETFYVGNL